MNLSFLENYSYFNMMPATLFKKVGQWKQKPRKVVICWKKISGGTSHKEEVN